MCTNNTFTYVVSEYDTSRCEITRIVFVNTDFEKIRNFCKNWKAQYPCDRLDVSKFNDDGYDTGEIVNYTPKEQYDEDNTCSM